MTEDYKDTVTANVSRLGVKARAAGIHLIFAAQRPDVNVMPMQLRDNLGNRLILKVSSAGTSEIALGVKGAEELLGNGHLAAKLGGESGIIFVQAPYLSDPDIMRQRWTRSSVTIAAPARAKSRLKKLPLCESPHFGSPAARLAPEFSVEAISSLSRL